VLLLPLPQAERRFGLARGALAGSNGRVPSQGGPFFLSSQLCSTETLCRDRLMDLFLAERG
jgi:hypothetical protein